MKKDTNLPRVFFNASVIIAGLRNPQGGSGKIIDWVKKGKITGYISQIIVAEVIKNAAVTGITIQKIAALLENIFAITPAPSMKYFEKYKDIVIDLGDTHVIASTDEAKCDFLVTLDKKHLLILQDKINKIKILSPKNLIESLFKK